MGKRLHNVDLPLRQVDSDSHQHRHLFPSAMWQKIHHFFAKDDPTQSPIDCPDDGQWPSGWDPSDPFQGEQVPSRPVGVGLPRQATFRRQNSERRERLLPVEPGHAERRAVSSTRHVSTSLPRPRATSSPPYWVSGRVSAPAIGNTARAEPAPAETDIAPVAPSLDPNFQSLPSDNGWLPTEYRPPRPPSTTSSDDSHYGDRQVIDDKAELRAELDSRWILNLSMHFRDKSDREKFFVTYAQTPTHWRRVTISCDYRNAEPGSLEMDLKELQFQRDKSLQIYESIRDSLPEIQFYDTVTNLKLETTDGRLHVHVTEDVNEIIPYPPRSTVAHILNDDEFRPLEIRESDLTFDSHLSGFVYKVRHKGKTYIKKEIPGPDTVDEFLYEINALHALHDSSHVISLEAIVVDQSSQTVKGLLISYAAKGAIVDLLYDHKGSTPWEDRCRWAEQAVRGLSEIHEEGYVQGDFTLSNIVVDGENNAKIIDINRRGCPVGWEPPEIATKIASNQRISMYIGEKSDLYQLGMTLWALAMDDDEPERHVPPLSVDEFPSEVPDWYQGIVRICLSSRPRDRLSAKDLIDLFPEASSSSSAGTRTTQRRPTLKLLPPKEYIDPANAVERDDIERFGHDHHDFEHTPYSPGSSRDDYTFTYPKSSNYELESESSAYDRPRGRRPPTNFAHLGTNERRHWLPDGEDAASIDDIEPNIVAISPGGDREYYDEVELNGHPYLISRGTFNSEELQILEDALTATGPTEAQEAAVGEEVDDVAGPLGSSSHQTPRRPPLASRDSATSDITPRGSHAVLPAYDLSPLDVCSADAASGHDSEASENLLQRDTLSAHGVTPEVEAGVRCEPVNRGPPRLPYEDSGYDEPLHLSDEFAHAAIVQTSEELDAKSQEMHAAKGGATDVTENVHNDSILDLPSHPIAAEDGVSEPRDGVAISDSQLSSSHEILIHENLNEQGIGTASSTPVQKDPRDTLESRAGVVSPCDETPELALAPAEPAIDPPTLDLRTYEEQSPISSTQLGLIAHSPSHQGSVEGKDKVSGIHVSPSDHAPAAAFAQCSLSIENLKSSNDLESEDSTKIRENSNAAANDYDSTPITLVPSAADDQLDTKPGHVLQDESVPAT